MTAVGNAIEDSLDELRGLDGPALRLKRRDKFLEMGQKGLSLLWCGICWLRELPQALTDQGF